MVEIFGKDNVRRAFGFVTTFVLLGLLFALTHVWNFKTAPWNQNGLFDDAAWDIYFAKTHVLSNEPFQPAYSDGIGIAREAVFHCYITAFFVLFGYNLQSFPFMCLGYRRRTSLNSNGR